MIPSNFVRNKYITLNQQEQLVQAVPGSPCCSRLKKLHLLPLSLLMLGVLTDHSDTAFSLDDLTFLTDWLYGCSDLHSNSLLSKSLPFIIAFCQ